jgi:hypothetical protein
MFDSGDFESAAELLLPILDATSEDCNGNGVPDELDLTAGTLHDADGDGIVDECGACCGTDGCIQVTEARCEPFARCEASGKYRGFQTTCAEECADPIPTVSEWGLTVMTLLMLTVGTLVLRRRRAVIG